MSLFQTHTYGSVTSYKSQLTLGLRSRLTYIFTGPPGNKESRGFPGPDIPVFFEG
jgi:hypothetical protein